MTLIDHPERVKAKHRGDLAERMTRLAQEFACLVRDEDRETIGSWIAVRSGEEKDALLVVLAAMADIDRPAADLLSWVTWDEFGQPLQPVRRRGPLEPCGTYAAWRRHKRRDEPTVECGCEAAKNQWRADYQRDRRKGAREAAAA